jgi:hypothetical protein
VELTLARTSDAFRDPLTARLIQPRRCIRKTAPAWQPRTALVWVVALLLSLLHGVIALTAADQKSPTFDEPTHLTAG